MHLFISHASENDAFVNQLAADLESAGVQTWVDHHDIPPGANWDRSVASALKNCTAMIVVLTPCSVDSENVTDEWNYFLEENKPIYPVLAEGCEVPFRLRRRQRVDFTRDHAAAMSELLEALGIETSRAQQAARPRVVDLLPPPFEWIDIPAGRVELEGGRGAFDVPAFMIAKYPITNAQYGMFMKAGGYREQRWWTAAGWQVREEGGWTEPRFWTNSNFNGAEQPVVGVSWYEAVAFCQWLSEVSGEPVMLPTEQQWQRAAQDDDGRTYPWGNDWDGARCNNSVSPFKSDRTTPVRQYERRGDSPFGVVDMAGNVWEWCLTVYASDSTSLEGTASRVLRGGSWYDFSTDNFRVSYRPRGSPGDWTFNYGFRCARSK